MTIFSASEASMLGWKFAYVCHDIRTEKKSIYGKESEYKTSN